MRLLRRLPHSHSPRGPIPFHNVDCTSRCVMDGLIRTAVDRCGANQVCSVTMDEVWAQQQWRLYVWHESQQHTGWNGVNGWMVRSAVFLSHGLIQTGSQGRAVITSLVEYALSLCGVTSRDTRRASRASFSRPYHNQRVELRFCRQRVKQQHKEKLGLEQLFRAMDFLP